MDKNAIKKYAVWARRELIARVSQKALQYGISETDFGDAEADSINGVVLSAREKSQRSSLIAKIRKDGYQQAMEEAAYTWFNRFTALRYMEVNAYLPSHVRVFTNDRNEFKPQIIDEAINLEIDGLDLDKVYEYKDANKTEELYKYLLITQCNDLGKILPGMFKKISDYTELLFPDNLLREGSVIEQMISLIPEEDWNDQVQIIGWLYQYYNTEPKDKVFEGLKKNIKITKENIPAATQLFTPDWIVRYMVENSLGRLWTDGHGKPENAEWKYYLEEAEQEPEVQVKLAEIRKEYADIKPEDIKCIDPCMGSGHILVYMFDVLVQIYESYGYSSREAARMILENNLYGLDIDDRAVQLAYFSVMMKARQYDRRFFSRATQPHMHSIRESNGLDKFAIDYFCNGDNEIENTVKSICDEMYDAKEYGAIINVSKVDFELLYSRFNEIETDNSLYKDIVLEQLLPLIALAEVLAQKYDIVCTNPPYMSANGMSPYLTQFVKVHYPDAKADMFSCFMEKCFSFAKSNGTVAMITMESWMFLSSFEKMRTKFLDSYTIYNMVHMPYLGKGGTSLGINFGTSATVFLKHDIQKYKAQYDYVCYYDLDEFGVPVRFPIINNRYVTSSIVNFKRVPGNPIAYWLSESFITAFNRKSIGDKFIPKFGMSTGDGNKFIRFWFESDINDIDFSNKTEKDADASHKKWVPIDKGGAYRRWYGNQNCIVWWKNNGAEIRNHPKSAVRSPQYFFQPHISWTLMTTGTYSARYFDCGFTIDTASNCIYFNGDPSFEVLGFLNSKVAAAILNILNPTINFSCGVISLLPFDVKSKYISDMVQENVAISKDDWNSFEISWAFGKHPLIQKVHLLSEAFCNWENACIDHFLKMKNNEEKINQEFIHLYNMDKELSIDINDEEISVYTADKCNDIKSFISYAVGCMFGRYSLDVEGLTFAGGEWDNTKYKSFIPTEHNIIPISDDEYFKDDITERFISFVKTVYSEETLEENLQFIADALGGKGTPREIIRKYFINDFFADHCKIYQKRPIYWLFDSGKKNGFKALIYMHRYQPDTIARIRTDYVHEQQNRYRTAISDIEQRMSAASTSERVKLSKELKKLNEQADELLAYEEKIHHLADQMISIDLDDGVKNNYEIFKDVLAKIK